MNLRSSLGIFALFCLNCGGEEFTSSFGSTANSGICEPGKQITCPCPGDQEGAQACKDDGTGYKPCQCSGAGGEAGMGGSGGSGGSGGIGGDSCVPTITCGNINDGNPALCGSFMDDCGHQVTCPDQCQLPETCQGGPDTNKWSCGCTPKNHCADLGFDCGSAPDGCGGEIGCGTCDASQNMLCGGATPNGSDCYPDPLSGPANHCGYTCGPAKTCGLMSGCNNGLDKWLCYLPTTSSAPKNGCVVGAGAPTGEFTYWCCS